jgi:hypothetical protein
LAAEVAVAGGGGEDGLAEVEGLDDLGGVRPKTSRTALEIFSSSTLLVPKQST